jgi:GAF domain-containing protein
MFLFLPYKCSTRHLFDLEIDFTCQITFFQNYNKHLFKVVTDKMGKKWVNHKRKSSVIGRREMYREDVFITTLLNIAKALTSARNLPAVLNYVVSSIANLFRTKACSIRLINEANKTLELAAAFGLSDRYLKKGPVEIEKSLVDKEALEGATVFIRDVTQDMRWQYPEEAKREGIHSVLCTPLLFRDRAIGTLRIYSSTARDFESSEIEMLKILADLAATAIENARVHKAFEDHCANLEILNEVAEKINMSLQPKEVAGLIVEHTAKALGVKACSLGLLDEKGKILALAAASGLGSYLRKGSVEVEKSLLDKEALKGKVAFIENAQTDFRWPFPEEAKQEGIFSVMVAPLVVKKRRVGVIRIYSDKPHKFSASEQQFLKAIARHASIALENARLYELALKNYDQLVQEVWQGLPDVWGTVVGAG